MVGVREGGWRQHQQECAALKKQVMHVCFCVCETVVWWGRARGRWEQSRPHRRCPVTQPATLHHRTLRHCLQVPARSATLAEQEGTRREIADLASQSADLDMLFEQRKAQFAGVLAALEQLQRSIDKDEPEESVVVLPDQQGGGGGCGAAAGGKPAAGAQVAQQQQRQAMQVG